MKLALLYIILISPPNIVFAGHPDCAGINRWATSMAFVYLKNSGITNNEKINFTKTITTRLASEKISKNIYRQIHYITFTENSGNEIKVITSNESSNEECSMSKVKVYVISKELSYKHDNSNK